MHQVASFQLAATEIDSSVGAVVRFERVRILGTLIILGLVGLASVPLGTAISAVAAGVAIVVIAVLGFGWLRAVRRAGQSALVFTAKSAIILTDDSIGLENPQRTETLSWNQIMHVTETDNGWLFVARKSNTAILIPRYAMAPEATRELKEFLSTWPRRRMRRVPVRR